MICLSRAVAARLTRSGLSVERSWGRFSIQEIFLQTNLSKRCVVRAARAPAGRRVIDDAIFDEFARLEGEVAH